MSELSASNISKFLVRVIETNYEEAYIAAREKVPIIEEIVDNLRTGKDIAVRIFNQYVRKGSEKQIERLKYFYRTSEPLITEICLFTLTAPGPWLFLLLCYLSMVLVRFSKYLSRRLEKPLETTMNRAVAILANFWAKYTSLVHDHRVFGMENIPSSSGALLVWYHGPVPVDYMGLVSRLYLRDGRLVHTVVDRFLTRLPYWQEVETHLRATAGGKGYCVDLLENGELLGVAVGGSREALFDHDYSANWGGRNGFAKVAMLTGFISSKEYQYIIWNVQVSPLSRSSLRTSARLTAPCRLAGTSGARCTRGRGCHWCRYTGGSP